MKYLGFDDRYYTIQSSDYVVYNDDLRSKSEPHLRARELLKKLYPVDIILEEVSLPIHHTTNRTLYADFLLPKQKMVVEVHGEQHYEFNSFFHKNKLEFAKAKVRDKLKKEWCQLNNLEYIELPYNESIEQWRDKLY